MVTKEDNNININCVNWVDVNMALPENEVPVLVSYTTKVRFNEFDIRYFNGVTIGFYEDGSLLEDDSEYCWDLDDCGEYYNEEADCYYVPEGWWEQSSFGETFSIIDARVNAWATLPEAIDGAGW